jgi:ankyrin repeat protein
MCPASSTEVQVEYWVDKGADVTGADYDKRTPLHIAAADGHLKVVKFLVRKGASVNAEDRSGSSNSYSPPHHWCADAVSLVLPPGLAARPCPTPSEGGTTTS